MKPIIKQTSCKEIIKLTPFFLFFVLLTWFVSGNIFFWDTIQLGARHGLFFYENNFSQLLLPESIDSGHIPTFGAYLALVWIIFGKSLLVSHFAMLPFLFGIIWQSFILLKKFINPKYLYFALILFLADATLLSQSTLMSPDIVLVFFFLLGVNSILQNRKLLLSVAIIGLFLVSMRGMIVAFALLIIDIILNIEFKDIKSVILQLLRKSIIYLPALLIFILYNLYHYKQKGWIGYHDDSPWAVCFVPVGIKGFLFNLGILIWRLIDFGRVFIWIGAFVIVLKYFKEIKNDKKPLRIVIIFFAVLFCLSISFLLYKGLSMHRYLLPVYLVVALFVIYLIFEKLKTEKAKYIVFTLVLIGLLSGNLWVYPEKISQGWDATLAHLPYYGLRKQMINYIEQENINFEDVACVFPNTTEQKFLELSNDTRKHVSKDIDNNKYVLYSNIYNDFKDDEIDKLKSDFILLKEFKRFNIFLRLYKKGNEF